MRLVGGVVEGVDADGVGDAPRDGRVLLGADVPVQRHDEPVARLVRGVAVRGVQAPGVAVQHVADGLDGVGQGVVDVEGHEAPERHRLGLAGPPDPAADEAADVLDAGALVLGHGAVLGAGLPGALACGELAHQVCPAHLPRLPVLAEARGRDGYGQWSHFC